MSVKTAFVSCNKQFRQLLASGLLKATESEVPFPDWRSQLGRSGLWGDDVGLHHKYQESLEFKLRDNSSVERQVVSVLRALQGTLSDVEIAVNDPAPNDAKVELDKQFGGKTEA